MKSLLALNISLIVLLIFMSSDTLGQSNGFIKVKTNPSKSIIKLDTMTLKSKVSYQVQPGNYQLKIWAPKRELFEKNIIIKSDSTSNVAKSLIYKAEYKKYYKDMLQYRIKKLTHRYLPIPLFLGLTYYSYKKTNNYKEDLDENYSNAIEAKEQYNNAVYIEDIKTYKNNYTYYKEGYDKNLSDYNRTRIITYSTLAVGTVVSYYLLRKSRKMVKPTYQETKLLSNIHLNYIESSELKSIQLTYNF